MRRSSKALRALFVAVTAVACASQPEPTPVAPSDVNKPVAAAPAAPEAPQSPAAPTAPAAPAAPEAPAAPSAPAAPAPPSVPATATAPAADAAPDFALRDTNGAEHRLSQYRGKVVVLEWTNHGCPFVKRHYDLKNMQAVQKQTTDKGAVWLSICSSAEGKEGWMTPDAWNRALADKGASATATLLDADGKVGRLYGARVTPHMWVVDAEGRIAYQGAIDDKPFANAANIAAARNYVREAVDALLAGKRPETPSTKPYG